MKQARNTKEKSAEPLERGRPEEHQPDELSRQHSLLQLQRLAGNRAVLDLMESRWQLQTKLRVGEPADEHEHEADQAADQVLRLSKSPSGVVQRKCADCSPGAKCAACEEEEEGRVQRKLKNPSLSLAAPQIQRAPRNGDSSAPKTASEPAPATAGPLIVDDDAATVAPGQMRKSEFLEQLRSTVCATADEALKEANQTTEGCPYIEKWLSYYAEQEPAHIERALRKYAPEAATATSARDYIPAMSNRVRRGVATWARTGEVPELPPELAGMLPGAGGAFGVVAGMIGGAVSAVAGAVGSAFSSIGKALFKRKEGSARETDEPQEIQGRLSGGQPLDGGAQSRMGAAFGHDFSAVRVHTDSGAARLSDQLNARAFTVGSDIAFSAGEYQPGTLIGDALIAHELAHVVQQQGGGNGSPEPQSKSDAGHDALEEDADLSAVGAVVSTWDGPRGALSKLARNAGPRLRSGLKLQRCASCGGSSAKKASGSDRWNVPCLLGILCDKDASVVEKLRTSTTTKSVDLIKIDEWRFKDGKWEEWSRTNTLGTNDSAAHLIRMRNDRSCSDAAETIFHEVHHQGQDPTVPWADREIEAYTVTERWTIERGLPGRPELRKTDPITGEIVPDPDAIEAHVRGYPGMATPGEQVIGKTADGKTRVKRDDGSEFTRAPVEGDRFRIKINYVNEETIDPKLWVCP